MTNIFVSIYVFIVKDYLYAVLMLSVVDWPCLAGDQDRRTAAAAAAACQGTKPLLGFALQTYMVSDYIIHSMLAHTLLHLRISVH